MRTTDVTDIPDELPPGTVLLDVREDDEWAAGHAPQATWVPLSRIGEHPFQAGTTYLAICRSGARSAQVVAALDRAGYDAVDVTGGMQAWAAAGRPMVAEGGGDPVVA